MYEALEAIVTAVVFTGLRGFTANIAAPVAVAAVLFFKLLRPFIGK